MENETFADFCLGKDFRNGIIVDVNGNMAL